MATKKPAAPKLWTVTGPRRVCGVDPGGVVTPTDLARYGADADVLAAGGHLSPGNTTETAVTAVNEEE